MICEKINPARRFRYREARRADIFSFKPYIRMILSLQSIEKRKYSIVLRFTLAFFEFAADDKAADEQNGEYYRREKSGFDVLTR